MILSIYAEKHFINPFMIKALNKIEKEGKYPNIIKSYITNPQLISYSMVKTESFPSKIRCKTRMSTLITLIQHSTGSPSQGNQARERNK